MTSFLNSKISSLFFLFFSAFFFASCASGPKTVQEAVSVEKEVPGLSHDSIEAIRAIEEEIRAADDDMQEKHEKHRIPIEINHLVRKWVHYFTVTDRDRFQRFLHRGAVYEDTVKAILREYGVPTELYYLGMIESGYYTAARSRARAVGPWQFMIGTSRMYGLKTNSYVDERRDIVRSTKAAARYLKTLKNRFDSWYLAMAGYNAGEGRIAGAIRRGRSRDFWILVEKRALPPETRDYVPKFLAAVIIGRNLSKYGFEKPSKDDVFPEVRAVNVPGAIKLHDIAQKADMKLGELKELNRHILRDMTPVGYKRYGVWLPSDNAIKLELAKHTLVPHRVSPSARSKKRYVASRAKRPKATYHRVKRGEALSIIASRYNISTAKLKRLNRLKSNQIYAGQRLKLPHNL